MNNFTNPFNNCIVRTGIFILLSLNLCLSPNPLSAQEPTFNELIEKINAELEAAKNELKATKKKLNNLTTNDLVKAYETEIEFLEKQIETLKSDEKFIELEKERTDCMDEKEQFNIDRKNCENEKLNQAKEHLGLIEEKETEIDNLNDQILEVEIEVVTFFENRSPIYTIDYLLLDNNISSLTNEIEFYSKRSMSDPTIKDSLQVVNSELMILEDVLNALDSRDIYYDKEISNDYLIKLKSINSKSFTKVANTLSDLLINSNCYNLRKELELELHYIKKDNDEIPEIFESILITYVYDNPIDISDIQYYTWLVKQYEVISQKGDIDSSDLQID